MKIGRFLHFKIEIRNLKSDGPIRNFRFGREARQRAASRFEMQDSSDFKILLAPYRVLDLSDESGYSCGKILAELGA